LFDENRKSDSYHVGHQLRLKYQKENPFASLPVTIRPFLRPGAFFSQTDCFYFLLFLRNGLFMFALFPSSSIF